jgi:hypothetical protein
MADDTRHDSKSGSSGSRISPISLQKHLKGTSYPASKEELVKRAQTNDAPADVLEQVRQLPSHTYTSPADVMKAFGKTE